MLNKTLTGEEISKLAVKIEATDSLLLNQHSIFNPLTADIKKYLGGINDAKVVILEPSDILDTKSFLARPSSNNSKDFLIISLFASYTSYSLVSF